MTTGFFLAPFAVGGLLAAFADAAGGGEVAAVAVFVVVSVMSLLLVRPIVQSRVMRSSPTLRTGAAALIGFSIVAASLGRLTGVGAVRADYGSTVQTTPFRFEDRTDGGISVIAPETSRRTTSSALWS